MSRGIGTTNESEVDSSHLSEVLLAKLEFDTPIYVHTRIGSITYNGDTYLGVGDLSSVTPPRESETIGPAPITLSLSGVDSDHITEALDSGNLYDDVTLYVGYRQDDGTLVDDPWVLWSGWYEYGSIELDEESSVSMTCQHDLSQLSDKNGSRYSDEDQQSKHSGDLAMEFTANTNNTKLLWAGGPVGGQVGGNDGNFNQNRRDLR